MAAEVPEADGASGLAKGSGRCDEDVVAIFCREEGRPDASGLR